MPLCTRSLHPAAHLSGTVGTGTDVTPDLAGPPHCLARPVPGLRLQQPRRCGTRCENGCSEYWAPRRSGSWHTAAGRLNLSRDRPRRRRSIPRSNMCAWSPDATGGTAITTIGWRFGFVGGLGSA